MFVGTEYGKRCNVLPRFVRRNVLPRFVRRNVLPRFARQFEFFAAFGALFSDRCLLREP